ncbi:unnamed protein product [Paramecium primaurelia]|uniref:Protein kinase domain-containing protein n=1 Tax=Paramecium primaurelia TaxID=5886 RepID=A0A8S1KUS4_PARPR|nr:unnamed protein product [Paramecium primaurelia]
MNSDNTKITTNQSTYSILNKLGEGSFGVVFKCKNEQTNEIVAIKIQKSINNNELEMLNKMKGQTFKNLIKTYELYQEYDMYYIVMEYCKESLYDRICQKGKVKPDDVRFIMKAIGNGIKEIHDLGYAHRDIKPENILIFQIEDANNIQEIYKICDFGTIKNIDLLKTQTVGTAYYQAPEQLNYSNHYSQKVDIWAFGAVIYELLTQTPLFNGFTEDEIKQKILNITQSQIDQTINNQVNLDRKYKTLLLNMLQIDPNKRHDINKFVEDMRGYSQNVTRNQIQRIILSNQNQVNNFISDLPIPNNYSKFKNPQRSTCTYNLPKPAILQKTNEQQQNLQQVQNFNNQIPFARQREINNQSTSSRNSYSLNSRNNQFQAQPVNNVQEVKGKSQEINQFEFNKSMEIQQNQNICVPQQLYPLKQQVPSVPRQFSPFINLQQSQNKQSPFNQNQFQQQNQKLQNNYFFEQKSQNSQQNPQSKQIQIQNGNNQCQNQIQKIKQNAFQGKAQQQNYCLNQNFQKQT